MNIVPKKYFLPFVLIASLFFCWGFAHSILDILNKHFQDQFEISKTRSALIQTMIYGGYFVMAFPAGKIISRWGYKVGIIIGLILYGIGALMFIPGEYFMNFDFFLFCLFVIGCGLTCLETAANPYITVLGDPETAASRLNLAQSLNGLGWIVGPLIGGFIIFGDKGSVSVPYAVIGVTVIVIAVVFCKVNLPEIVDECQKTSSISNGKLIRSKPFIFGLVTLFFYVAAQTGVNSFFINYVTENVIISNRDAALLLSFGGMGLFLLGRFVGTWLMNYIRASQLLLYCAVASTICMIVVMIGGAIGLFALILTYLFESIMFPTIFALSLHGLDSNSTKRGSSYLIMMIVGGAIAPVFMGFLGEDNMNVGFIVPLICYIVIGIYAYKIIKK